MRQQPALALEAAAIARKRSVGPDHAVTGHDNADRVGAVRKPDSAHGLGNTKRRSNRSVAHRAPRPDRPQCGPDSALERRATRAAFDPVQLLEVPSEIGLEGVTRALRGLDRTRATCLSHSADAASAAFAARGPPS